MAARYPRLGALQLFCALIVAGGLTYAATFARKCFADFKHFLTGLFATLATGVVKVLDLILDNGPTHAPRQLGGWIASLELSFEVRSFWLPTDASWLDQVELVFSKVTRDALTPNDFQDKKQLEAVLMHYLCEDHYRKIILWAFMIDNFR